MTSNDNERNRVKSVETGLRLLQCLAGHGTAITLKDLAQRSGLHASKAHRYLASLMVCGMVEQDPDSGRYRLGPESLHIGLAALSQLDLPGQALTCMQQLVAEHNETVLLSVWGNNGPAIIKMLEPPRPVTVNVRVGFSLPLLSSATGLVFAAWLPWSLTDTAIKRELKMLQQGGRPDSPRDLDAVHGLLQQIRERGLSRVKGALMAGINSLAAPVFDHSNGLAGVITILGAADHININWNGPIAASLADVAAQISRNLGHIPSTALQTSAGTV